VSYPVPSLEKIHRFAISFWKSLNPTSDVLIKFSYHWKRLLAYAAVQADQHAHVLAAQDDVMPDTALGSTLLRWSKAVGIKQRGATGARKAKALRVTGTAATPVANLAQLIDPITGNLFQIVNGPFAIGAGGTVDCDIAAISTGSSTRLLVGASLSFVTPIPFVKSTATIVLPVDQDGFDIEQEPSLSNRMQDAFADPGTGASAADFEKWTLDTSTRDIVNPVTVASCYVYANRQGLGSVDIAAFHSGTGAERNLIGTEPTLLLGYLQQLVPLQLGANGGALRVLTTVIETKAVEITFTTNGDPAVAWDWDDSAPPVVLAYNATTKALQFTGPVPTTMIAGKRFVVRGVGSAQDGAVFTVDTVSASDTILVRETPTVNFAATDVLYAASPITASLRDAIIGYMSGDDIYADTNGPIRASTAGTRAISSKLRVLVYGLGPSNPSGAYGQWNGTLSRADLSAIVNYAAGVRKPTIVTPAADVDSTDYLAPNDTQIGYIGPGAILLRRG